MTTLTVEDCDRFPDEVRDEFYAWLEAEGLMSAWIVEGRFGEGVLQAKCVERDEHGEAVWDDEAEEPSIVERTFTLKAPPPASALAFAK